MESEARLPEGDGGLLSVPLGSSPSASWPGWALRWDGFREASEIRSSLFNADRRAESFCWYSKSVGEECSIFGNLNGGGVRGLAKLEGSGVRGRLLPG